MSITVATIQTDTNTYIGDASTDRISAAQRLAAITEATVDLAQRLNNDHQVATLEFDFFDTVNYYKLTSSLPDFIEPTDLTIENKDYQDTFFTRKSPQELRIEVGHGFEEESYAVERRDSDLYLIIQHASRHSAVQIANFDSLTEDGTWALDTTNGDGTNLTVDTNELKEGSGCLNFDIDVSQTANNLVKLQNSTIASLDLSDHEDLSSFIFWTYLPDVTNFTSVTLYWGSSSTSYWSATATTDIDGAAFANGWNQIKIDWADATATSSPDVTAIDYLRVDWNYGAGQGDDTDFRVDDLKLIRPEKMRLHYMSWDVGTDTTGTAITAFTATTDIPFFSGKYDHYRYIVAHKSASILYKVMRLSEEAQFEDFEAERIFKNINKMFPKSTTPEVRNFKIRGINFNK